MHGEYRARSVLMIDIWEEIFFGKVTPRRFLPAKRTCRFGRMRSPSDEMCFRLSFPLPSCGPIEGTENVFCVRVVLVNS